ncbi:MAG: surface lipoprotein assembly modifier [Rhodospirillales bacterium]|nr:surface lipoprotein assembly modifier [Rhodospirillales bacterium]
MAINLFFWAPTISAPLLLCAVAISSCIALTTSAWSAEHDALLLRVSAPTPDTFAAADTTTVSEAQALIETGRFAEALTLLRPLLDEEAVEPNVLFLYGLASLEASQHPEVVDDVRKALLNEAIAAFRTMLVAAPGLVRVRLELARAFFLKGEDDLAVRHFEAVLAGGVPETVAANVRDFLNEIRARDRWRFNLGAALAPDTNIGAGSEERTIYIFGLPFERDAEELTTSGVGVAVWGGAEYQVPVAERWRLRAGGEAARREYGGSEFDQLFLSTHLGPRWLVDARTEGSLLASARQRWTGTAPDNREFGARLEVGHRITPRVTTFAQASWHDRRYRNRPWLDGPIMDASLRGSWVVTPTVRADLSAGYAEERPESLRYRNSRRWIGAGITVILPLGFTLGGGGEVRWTDFEGEWPPHTPAGEDRADRTRSLRLSVHNRALTVYGFSPELVVVNEQRETNAQLYDYERTHGELRFVRQF